MIDDVIMLHTYLSQRYQVPTYPGTLSKNIPDVDQCGP